MAEGGFSFVGAIELLKRLGMFDIILPIILVYAIVFGVLQRSNMFTRKNKKGDTEAHKELNATIAFIIALLVIGAANITGIIQKFMPFVGLISVLAVSFLMLVGLITGDLKELLDGDLGKALKPILIVLTAIAFMFTFGMAAGWWDLSIAQGIMLSGEGLFTSENVSAIIFLLILVGIIAWISNSSKNA
jgi:hypothetical protein